MLIFNPLKTLRRTGQPGKDMNPLTFLTMLLLVQGLAHITSKVNWSNELEDMRDLIRRKERL